MENKLNELLKSAIEEIKKSNDLNDIEKIRIKYLGKKGQLTLILREMGNLSKELRPIIGQKANEVRFEIERILDETKTKLEQQEKFEKIRIETIDITERRKVNYLGHKHPLLQTIKELEDLFISMGFNVVTGPEIETVENNFDMLNSPENHPSRDLSDTFYINDKLLLRTHTSPVQIRAMMKYNAPLKIISAGRTFRFDDVDDTHSPMFHQLEGLVVDENISMANLKYTLDIFIKELFGKDMKTRYRPHYFPFTEPSAEVDVTCVECRGEG